jgi:hypothetical protein
MLEFLQEQLGEAEKKLEDLYKQHLNASIQNCILCAVVGIIINSHTQNGT